MFMKNLMRLVVLSSGSTLLIHFVLGTGHGTIVM